MSEGSRIISAGIRMGAVDRAAVCVKTILADPKSKIAAWTEGRVFRGNLWTMPAKVIAPAVLVHAMQPTEEFEVGQCIEVTAPILVAFVWEDPASGYLSDSQPSIESAVAEAKRELANNMTLVIPLFGNRAQAQAIVSIEPFGRPTPSESTSGVALFQSMLVNYRLNLNRRTWDHET